MEISNKTIIAIGAFTLGANAGVTGTLALTGYALTVAVRTTSLFLGLLSFLCLVFGWNRKEQKTPSLADRPFCSLADPTTIKPVEKSGEPEVAVVSHTHEKKDKRG